MLHVSYIVNSIFSSRTYVLSFNTSDSVWLVDCGDVEKLPSSAVVKGVLLTHAHFDHIYGLPELLEKFPDCKVVTSADGLHTLADSRSNMSKYHESPIEVRPSNTIVCGEGDVMELLDGVSAKVYETPGHHPSCLTFEVEGYLFTGDAYIPGVKPVTNLPGGIKALAEASLHRILSIAEGLKVCPGHQI